MKKLLLSLVLLSSTSNLVLAGGLEWLEKANKEHFIDQETGVFDARGVRVFTTIGDGGYISGSGSGRRESLSRVIEKIEQKIKALDAKVLYGS